MSHDTAIIPHRRISDGRFPWVAVGERILLWGTVLGMVGAGAMKYAKLVETMAKAEDMDKRVYILEKDKEVSAAKDDERWRACFDRLDRIERKLDRR